MNDELFISAAHRPGPVSRARREGVKMCFRAWVTAATLLLSLLCSQGVNAQDYIWRHNYSSQDFPSAVDACKAVFELRAQHYPGVTYSYLYINPNRPHEAVCGGRRSNGADAGFIHSVTRYGDGCTAPAVFNPQTGGCESAAQPNGEKCGKNSLAVPPSPKSKTPKVNVSHSAKRISLHSASISLSPPALRPPSSPSMTTATPFRRRLLFSKVA